MAITNPKYRGRDMVLNVWNGSSYVLLGGLRTTTLTIGNEQVDITDKDDDTFRKLLADAGVRTVSFTAAGLLTDDTQFDTLRDQSFAASIDQYQMYFGNGDLIDGEFQVASFEITGEYNGAQEFSVTLESANTITLN